MTRLLFASDLDNTLLFSFRYRQPDDRCVEWLDGQEQGFLTHTAIELLKQVCETAQFVPVTTRSIAQYRRIVWPEGCAPTCALTTNGATRLINGEIDPVWQAESLAQLEPWREELNRVQRILEAMPGEKRVYSVEDFYRYAAFDTPVEAEACVREFPEQTGLTVSVSGRKVYWFPPFLNKGTALERLRTLEQAERILSAGDSVIDLPMLRQADIAVVPSAELLGAEPGERVLAHPGGERFSEFVLRQVLQEAERT